MRRRLTFLVLMIGLLTGRVTSAQSVGAQPIRQRPTVMNVVANNLDDSTLHFVTLDLDDTIDVASGAASMVHILIGCNATCGPTQNFEICVTYRTLVQDCNNTMHVYSSDDGTLISTSGTTIKTFFDAQIVSNESRMLLDAYGVKTVQIGIQPAVGKTISVVSLSAQSTPSNSIISVLRGGAKGSTVTGEITSTANGSNHQGVDVQLYDGSGNAVSPAKDTSVAPLLVSGGGGYIRQDSTATIAKESGGNLATVATDVAPLVVSSAGGYVRQDSTSTIAKESGGNLATLAGAVTSAVLQDNVKQFGGSAVVTGAGAGGAGIPRVTVSNDSSAIVGGWNVNGSATSVTWNSSTTLNTATTYFNTQFPYVVVSVTPTATLSTGALTFERSTNAGTSYAPLGCSRLPLATIDSVVDFTGSSTQQTWTCDNTGNAQFRVRLSTAVTGSGNLVVQMTASSAPSATGAVGVGGWLGSQAPTVGQKAMANALPVSIASDQSAIPVSGTFFQATQPVSGTFFQTTQPVSIATMPTTAVTGTFFQATQPVSGTVTANAGTGTLAVSAASLPLPTGAATSVKQPALGTAGAASADVITVQGVASMTKLLVTPDSVALPLHQSANIDQIGGATLTIGQQLAAASIPVILPAATVTTLTPPTTVTVTQATGTNLHTVTDSGTTTVTQATGTNLHAVLDSTSTTAVTQATAANLNATVVQATPASLQATVTHLTLTKGTQGSTGVSTQDLKDAGRTLVTLTAERVIPILTTDTIVTFSKLVGDTVTATQTTYAVTSGKTLRLQYMTISLTPSSTTLGVVQVRLRTLSSGACTVAAGVRVAGWEIGNPGTATQVANASNQREDIMFPDGMEFSGATRNICISMNALAAASQTVTISLVGYEY